MSSHSQNSEFQSDHFAVSYKEPLTFPTQLRNPDSIETVIRGFWSILEDKLHAGSITASVFTLIMATIGTGVLFLPYGISQSGLLWGLAQLFFCGWLGSYSVALVLKCAISQKVCSFQELAHITYGQKLRWFVNIVFIFGSAGTAVLHLRLVFILFSVLLGPCFDDNVPPKWLISVIVSALTLLIIFPASLQKEFKALRYIWFLGIFLLLFFGSVIIWEAFNYQPISQTIDSVSLANWNGFTTTMAASIFSFMNHYSILDIFGELRIPSEERMKRVVKATSVSVFVFYAIVSTFGYITFAINLYPLKDPAAANGLILVAYGYGFQGQLLTYPPVVISCIITTIIVITIKTPMYFKPAKDAIRDFAKPKQSDKEGEPVPDDDEVYFNHVMLTLFIICIGLIIGVFTSNAQLIMNLITGSFDLITCYVFPPLFYLKIFGGDLSRRKVIFHKVMMGFLVCFGMWNTFANVRQIIQSS